MTIKVWRLESLKEDMSFQAHEDPVCTLTGNDTYLFSGSLKSIKVGTLQSGYPTVRAHCTAIAIEQGSLRIMKGEWR